MEIDNSRKTITTFVLVDPTGKIFDDFENINENTEVRAIAIEPQNSWPMGDYKWICLIRKFYNCSFYNDSNAVQMFLHIFLNAQREDKPYFDKITMRGQFRTSIKDIMGFFEISRKSARRSLDKL